MVNTDAASADAAGAAEAEASAKLPAAAGKLLDDLSSTMGNIS